MRGSERVRSTSDQERESEKVQKEFLEWWIRNDTQSQYKLLAKTATFRCESELQRSRIQAVVSSRVKNVDSLRTKLDQRVSKSEKIYRERKDIISDIVDLAGVRVALYMPSQMDVIDKLIRKKFHVFHTKEHGVGKRTEENEAKRGSTSTEYVPHFAGYRAKHYRVTLDGPNSSNRLEGPIEIQVISMLNHTWAQVSHDLVYKQMNGLPSEEEIRILDGLDGLIQVGETLLQQLHGVFQRRVEAQNIPFQSEYKLASFLVGKEMGLQSWLPSLLEKRGIPSEFHFGSMGPLLKLLKSAKRASPRDLEPYIGQLGKSSILDGPLHHFLAQARRPKLDLSILLMERVLLDANAADQLKQNATWTDDTVICRIKVLVGTLVLLDNLFPPFKEWAPKLFVDQNLRHSFDFGRNVQWLIHAEHLQAVVERREPPAQELNYHLEQPWTWFSTQPNGLIEFAFKVSSHVDFADFDRLSYFKQVLTQAPFQDESKMVRDMRDCVAKQYRGGRSFIGNASEVSRFKGFLGDVPGMGFQTQPIWPQHAWAQPMSPQVPGYEDIATRNYLAPIDRSGAHEMGGQPQHLPTSLLHQQNQQYLYPLEPSFPNSNTIQYPPPSSPEPMNFSQ